MAAEHVLLLLDPEERDAATRRAGEDPAYRAALDAWSSRLLPLLEPRAPVAPPASVWAAIQRRTGISPERAAPRRDQGVWLDLAPGSRMKLLYVNPVTNERSALLRMEPGSVFPAHDHDQIEECFVVEGQIEIRGAFYGPGDFVVAGADTTHDAIPSAQGCLLMLHWNARAA